MTHFQMYLITRLDSVVILLGMVGGLVILAGVLVCLSKYTGEERWAQPLHPIRWMCIGVIMVGVACMIPSKNDIALIYAVPAIVNNEDIQALPPDLAKLARSKIEELLKEGKE